MHDLLELDATKFRNYIRMDPDAVEQLLPTDTMPARSPPLCIHSPVPQCRLIVVGINVRCSSQLHKFFLLMLSTITSIFRYDV